MVWTVYFWTLVAIYVLAYWIPAAVAGVIDPSGRLAAAICRSWARLVLRTARVRVSLDSADLGEIRGPRIYMSNHQSYFDVLALMAYLPDNGRFVAKKSLEYIPFFGFAMRAVGTVIIDRNRPAEAREKLNKIGGSNMGRGVGVIIFPEGTRSRDGNLGRFKKGGFVLALQVGAKIIPVAISGSNKVMPADSFRVKPGEIHISIGKPIPTGEFSQEDKDALMEKTKEAIGDLLTRTGAHNSAKPDDKKHDSPEAMHALSVQNSTTPPQIS